MHISKKYTRLVSRSLNQFTSTILHGAD